MLTRRFIPTFKTRLKVILLLTFCFGCNFQLFASTTRFIDEQKKIALDKEKSDPLLATEALLEIAKFYQSSDFDSVSVYVSKAMALATTHKFNDQIIRAWIIQTEIEYGDNIPKEVNCNKKYLTSEYLRLVIGLKKSASIKVDQNYLNKIDSILNYAIYVSEYKPDYNLAMLCYFRHKAQPKYLRIGGTLKYLLFASKMFNDLGKPVESLKANGFILKEYVIKKNAKEGILLAQKNLKVAKLLSSSSHVINAYVYLSDFYQITKNFQTASFYLNKALELSKKSKNLESEIDVYLNFLTLYFDQQLIDSSIIAGKKALSLMDKYKVNFNKIVLLNNLSISYAAKGDVAEALKCQELAELEAESVGDKRLQWQAKINLGQLYLTKKQVKKALTYFYKAKPYLVSQPEFEDKVELYDGLFKCYKILNNPDSVVRYLELKAEMKDSVQAAYNRNALLELSVKHEADETKAELAKVKLNLETKEKKQIVLLIIIGLLLVVGILLLLFNILSGKSKALTLSKIQLEKEALEYKIQLRDKERDYEEQERIRLAKDNEHKARELTSMAAIILETNKVLTEVEIQIAKLDLRVGNNKVVYDGLNSIIQHQKYADMQWKNFKAWFEELNPNFFDTLQNRHPKLSANDLRILAYLKMGMSNQQIALLQNIDPKSFFKSRQRLKEKLEVPTSEEIEKYLNSI